MVDPPQSCTVWWAPVDAFRAAHLDLLNTAEREKVARLMRDADRARSALGAAVLRLAVAERAGVRPHEVAIDRTCPDCDRPHGAPRLPGTGLWASVSHSGRWVAVAVTAAGPVGVDVERIAEVDTDGLGAHVLASGEAAAVRDLRDFFVYWTRKEAVLKATGEGLRVPMHQVLVGRADGPAELLGHPQRPGLRAAMFDLLPDDGHVAALAVLGERSPVVREADAVQLLTNDGDGWSRPAG